MDSSRRQNLIILGAGPFAAEVADLARDHGEFTVTGFVVSEGHAVAGMELEGLPVHSVASLAGFPREHHWLLNGIGSTRRGEFLAEVTALGFRFATVVHPFSRVSKTAVLEEGTLVSAGAVIAAGAHLERHVIVNRGALIGHHTQIGACSTIGPGANIAGGCKLGSRCYVGMSAAVVDHLAVGDDTVIGAGAVVTKSLPSRVQALGVPARIVRENIEGK